MKVSCEEIFGPVCTVGPYDTLEEALELANSTDYGLQAGIFTARVDTALAAAQGLEFGGVTVNEAPTFRADQMPYGGVKGSGNTKEGPAHAVREMTEERLVVLATWHRPGERLHSGAAGPDLPACPQGGALPTRRPRPKPAGPRSTAPAAAGSA